MATFYFMEHGHLPRLDESAYNGFASVHWNFTIKNRQTGWLDEEFHSKFREILLHSSGRFDALCPVYCLMPDHIHLLICGWSEGCRQRLLVRFLRKHTQEWLGERGFEWQKQPYDNVLREKERKEGAFEKVAGYVLDNPVRAGLVERWSEWPFTECMVPGYPALRIKQNDFWDRYWKIYNSRK